MPKGPTGHDLIEQDYKDEAIDYETYLTYRVQYVFGDSSLPDKYFTDEKSFEDDGLFEDLEENYDKLSVKNKEIIEPFLKRPDDPDSFINKLYSEEKEKTAWFIQTAHAAGDRPVAFKGHISTADNLVKVHFPIIVDAEGNETKVNFDVAKEIVKNLDNNGAYDQFKNLLNLEPQPDGPLGGDDKVDIYVVGDIEGKYAKLSKGLTFSGVNIRDRGKNTNFILLRNDLSSDELKTITVHELFHAFQRRFNCKGKKNIWWLEGSATWSEDYIYPQMNSEQEHIINFIPEPEVSLTLKDKKHVYGSYLFPFYLTQKYNDHEVVRKIFYSCDLGMDAIDGVEKAVPDKLKDVWSDFSLWLFNTEPVKYFKDESGFFPDDSSSLGENSDQFTMDFPDPLTIDTADLKPLTSQVIEVYNGLKKGEVKRIDFADLRNFTKNNGGRIKAIIYPKERGEEYIEDWSNREKRSFCLENKKEDILQVNLIVSNPDPKKSIEKTDLVMETHQSCYTINQSDHREASFGLGVSFAESGSSKGSVDVKTWGDMIEEPKKGAKYSYLGKWKIHYDYVEDIGSYAGVGGCTYKHKPSKFSGDLIFDLREAAEETGWGFAAQSENLKFNIPAISVNCGIGGDQSLDLSEGADEVPQQVHGGGKLIELTEDGAKVEFSMSYIFNGSILGKSAKPILVEIKREE